MKEFCVLLISFSLWLPGQLGLPSASDFIYHYFFGHIEIIDLTRRLRILTRRLWILWVTNEKHRVFFGSFMRLNNQREKKTHCLPSSSRSHCDCRVIFVCQAWAMPFVIFHSDIRKSYNWRFPEAFCLPACETNAVNCPFPFSYHISGTSKKRTGMFCGFACCRLYECVVYQERTMWFRIRLLKAGNCRMY